VVVETGIAPGDVIAMADPVRRRTEDGKKDKAETPAIGPVGNSGAGRP